jgi:hypothetical protein
VCTYAALEVAPSNDERMLGIVLKSALDSLNESYHILSVWLARLTNSPFSQEKRQLEMKEIIVKCVSHENFIQCGVLYVVRLSAFEVYAMESSTANYHFLCKVMSMTTTQ